MKKPSNGGSGAFDTPTYAEQLGSILEEIDGKVFRPFRANIKATPVPMRFPGSRSEGYHVKKVITYRVIYPAHPFTVGLMGEKFIESYFIWGEEIELIADEKLKNAAVQDFSDARFLRMLTACALVAVRYRVLWNKNFFLNARLRTCASAYRDTTIPEQHRTRLFAKHKECADLAKDPFALDAHILLTLVQMAQDDGAHLLDTLHYLTNSKEAS